jgi:excisionase family DNA binding protein
MPVRRQAKTRAEPPAVMTVAELARLLGVNRGTVYEAIERGQVPGVIRLGRRILIARAIVRSWLGQNAESEGKAP